MRHQTPNNVTPRGHAPSLGGLDASPGVVGAAIRPQPAFDKFMVNPSLQLGNFTKMSTLD